tara:strand:- start:174970 stop:175089 length:120 start_codon:yes stop_codon:yes gene_type:complete
MGGETGPATERDTEAGDHPHSQAQLCDPPFGNGPGHHDP